MNEFELIREFFDDARARVASKGVLVGIGDDCAMLDMPVGQSLAVSIDTQVAGKHFPKNSAPHLIAARALHCAVSDLAAMGAEPLWFTLALTLPASDSAWLKRFSDGLFEAAAAYKIALVGGDTTSGPLTITVQVHGSTPQRGRMLRNGAQPGDHIYVTGTLGDGAAGLAVIQGLIQAEPEASDFLQDRFYAPFARIRSGLLLRNVATACIDVSDGLLADLGHICNASKVGAILDTKHVPMSAELLSCVSTHQALMWALTGGDDYQLCFTAQPDQLHELQSRARSDALNVSCIGEVIAGDAIVDRNTGRSFSFEREGFQHFS